MKASLRSPLLFSLMLAGALMAALLKPTALLAEQSSPIDLETMVPARIGNWTRVPGVAVPIVDPGQQEMLEAIYTQHLARAYSDPEGYVVMLSIAYGKDQRDGLQVHRPEICYPAQGFVLLEKQRAALSRGEKIPVTRMQTQLSSRFEPVTYWTMIGDKPYAGSLDKKLAEMRYGLAGTVPDGMLVRISSIDRDAEAAFSKQSEFALAMIEALPAGVRPRFAGSGQ